MLEKLIIMSINMMATVAINWNKFLFIFKYFILTIVETIPFDGDFVK